MKRVIFVITVLCLILCSCNIPGEGGTGNTGTQGGLVNDSTYTSVGTEGGGAIGDRDDIGPLVPDTENEEAEYMGQDCFLAYVKGIGTQIEAQCLENQCIFGDVIINISPQTIFKDKDGKEIAKSQIKVGDKVKVEFDGVVTRSLPPQVVATQISLY